MVKNTASFSVIHPTLPSNFSWVEFTANLSDEEITSPRPGGDRGERKRPGGRGGSRCCAGV